jgi:hypothetical protein
MLGQAPTCAILNTQINAYREIVPRPSRAPVRVPREQVDYGHRQARPFRGLTARLRGDSITRARE